MFRNRRNSQKPSDELYREFKANFPQLGPNAPPATTTTTTTITTTSTHTQPTDSLAEALDVPINPRALDHQPHDIKDADSTPRGSNEPWNFGTSGLTPSLMDPNSNFNMFASHLPGYYTPTPGGTNTLYHSQAGDLHTPGFGMGLNTPPLSMPTSENALHAGQQGAPFGGFHSQVPQHLQSQQFQNVNPFQMHHHTQAFPPQQFSHQPTFDAMEGPVGDSPVDDLGMDLSGSTHQQHHSPEMLFQPPNLQNTMQPPQLHSSGEKFRFPATLNAPTAMIKHSDEIPVTYLNKGQAYTLNIVDTQTQQRSPTGRYRTFVRVSFEDEQQRQKPAACWQLWKEGRGTNEAHQRGGRLQAVEYVDSSQSGTEDSSRPIVELESESFDGFCVIWTPSNGHAECPISVRFNFLSTDFSHSKGVKGIPVRLCAKTEAIDEPALGSSQAARSEVCYSKVKLFRDHGAERKLSNDVAHVKKTIDKLNQQIVQIESGMRDSGKRKRSGSVAKGLETRPVKVPKHRRTWSMTSVTSNGGRGSAEEDLHIKLMTLQDMFTSTRPASILYLRGQEGDDPDLHPVKLTGEIDLVGQDTGESATTTNWERQSPTGINSSMVSPTPSNNSLIGSRKDPNMQQPTPIGGPSRENSNEWKKNTQAAPKDFQQTTHEHTQITPDNLPTKVETRSPQDGAVSGWIEAFGVDQCYQPPPERPIKPVACFYIRPHIAGKPPTNNYYRAVYLMNRTLKDFTNALARKCSIEPTEVVHTYRVTANNLHVLLDDDCVRELPEGQDMEAEFSVVQQSDDSTTSPIVKPKREWDATSTDVQCDGEISTAENVNSTGYELKLLF